MTRLIGINRPDRCLMDGCNSVPSSRGLCEPHYKIEHREGNLENWPRYVKSYADVLCLFPGCGRGAVAHDLCNAHYTQKRKGQPLTGISERKPCPNPRCSKKILVRSDMCKSCSRIRSTYGLSVEGLVSLMSNYVCSNPGCGSVKNLHMDHDHSCCDKGSLKLSYQRSCGKCVRGWLCSGCNTSLGLLQESPERIRGLLSYLEGVRR